MRKLRTAVRRRVKCGTANHITPHHSPPPPRPQVSALTLGAMNFGGTAQTQCSESESFAIMDAYVAAGGNVIDTANIYSGGESERIVGRWLKTPAMAGKRAQIVLASKARNAMAGPAGGPNDSGLSRSHLTAALTDSLERLQVDYIDLYQVRARDCAGVQQHYVCHAYAGAHCARAPMAGWRTLAFPTRTYPHAFTRTHLQCHVWDDGTPIEETLRTLNDFVQQGKIRYYGFSNTTGAQLQKIVETARRLGLAPCASLQQQVRDDG